MRGLIVKEGIDGRIICVFPLFFRAISIYLDSVNIFIRMVTILAGGGGRRK